MIPVFREKHLGGTELNATQLRLRALISILILLFSLPVVFAQKNGLALTNDGNAEGLFNTNAYYYDASAETGGAGRLVGMALKTLLLLGVFGAGIYFLFRYLMKKQNIGNVNSQMIRLVSQNTVGVGKYIQVVRILNSFYVLGVSDGSLNLIKEISDKEEIDSLKVLESRMTEVSATGFEEKLKSFSERLQPGHGRTHSDMDRTVGFLKRQKDRLKKMTSRRNDEK